MPRLDKLPPSSRVFAQVDRFTFECPDCQAIVVGDKRTYFQRIKARGKVLWKGRDAAGGPPTYNPVTGRVRCPQCEHAFGVGLLLWRVPVSRRAVPPPDQRPTLVELRKLKAYQVSRLSEGPALASGEEQNVLLPECTCDIDEGRYDDDCPAHGR